MESPTPVSRYFSQSSNKRVFPAGSGSSSSAYKDVEVLEIPPPINRTSVPPMSSKQKEKVIPEIIDVDMEDDSDDVMLTDGHFDPSGKGKAAFPNSVGFSSYENGGSGSDSRMSNYGVSGLHDSPYADDFSSDLFYDEDEWIDTYYDDILFDDYAMLESQFDHMDIPPGVEALFPWFPSSHGNDSKALMNGTSTTSSSELQMDVVNHAPYLSLSQPSLPSKHIQLGNQLSSRMETITNHPSNVDNQHGKVKLASVWKEHSLGLKNTATSSTSSNPISHSSKCPIPHKHSKDIMQSMSKSKRKSRASQDVYYNHPPPPTYASDVTHPSLNMSTQAPMPVNMFEASLSYPGYMPGSEFTSWANNPASIQNGASSMDTSLSLSVEPRNMDQILRNFDSFKKFDTVEDYSDHHYDKNVSAKQAPKNWAKRIQEEWRILEKDLPDKIFVRVYESRMDLLRAVIVGADGTPYHDGLFFFDVFFPSSYPSVPPHVHYHSRGLRINPNLYKCGKVCLSLLNTWTGTGKEKWIPGESTMLQVLVSIQGLILNAQPYFNEPGYANLSGSARGEERSLNYNEKTFMFSLQTMGYTIRRPPKHFEDFVIGYFCKNARDILVSCKAYLDGAQVGCLVKGSGIQDVNEGDKSCSQRFRAILAGFISVLIKDFQRIGAQGCEAFLSLAQKANEPPTNARMGGRIPSINLNY